MDRAEKRRLALVALVDQLGRGGIAKIARDIGKEASYVSRMLYPEGKSGAKRIGEDTAVALRNKYPDFFTGEMSLFDQVDPPPPQPKETALPPYPETSIADGEFVAVRQVDVKFSNGHGQVVYGENDKPPLMFRSDFLRKMGIPKGQAFVAIAEGISNEPKIYDGSVVLINGADSELDGDFFAFRVDGELLIKRLQVVRGAGILATAENSNFKPKSVLYNDSNEVKIIGKAVWTGTIL